MSQEILYTSAPQGLKPGSRGFCTVVSTSGMAKNLAERLESLSGYRHAYMPSDADAHLNPVNYSHLVMTVGGRKYHVLSRICDAGLDYTQRTNKLAHHVAIESRETNAAPGGPAWTLADNRFCVTQWDGETKILPGGRSPRAEDCPTGVCHEWKRLSGDEGWAGVLAESALQKGRPVSVIYKPGTDVLPLVVEALSLVPPSKRWQVTFSTYFTKAPGGADIQWRFLLDGTQEATALRRNVHATVIDLCNPLDQAQGGELVEAARTGVLPRREEPRRPAAAPQPAVAVPVVAEGAASTLPPPMQVAGAPVGPEAMVAPGAPQRAAWQETPPEGAAPPPYITRRRKPWWLLVLAPLLFVAIVGAMVGVYFATRSPARVVTDGGQTLQIGPPSPKPDERPHERKNDDTQTVPYDPTKLLPDDMRPVEPKPDAAPKVRSKSKQDRAPKKKPVAPPQPPKKKELGTFDDIERRQRRLDLPRSSVAKGSGMTKTTEANKEPKELAKLAVDDKSTCELALVADEVALKTGQKVNLVPKDQDGHRAWAVVYSKASIPGVQQVIALFELKGDSLSFRWEKVPKVLLEFCLLDITATGKTVRCTLNEPEPEPPMQLDLNKESQLLSMPPILEPGGGHELLRIDLWFEGGRGLKVEPCSGLEFGKTGSVKVLNPHASGSNKWIEFNTRLDRKDDGLAVGIATYAHIRILPDDSGKKKPQDTVYESRETVCLSKISQWKQKATKLGDDWKTQLDNLRKADEGAYWRAESVLGLSQFIAAAQRRQTDLVQKRSELTKRLEELWKTEASPERKKEDERLRAEKQNLQNQENQIKKDCQAKQDQLNQAPPHVKKLIKQIEALKYQITFAEDNVKWCDGTSQLLKTLQDPGRLHYRVYADVEGKQVDIARTGPP